MNKDIPLPREHTCPKCGHYIWAHPIQASENAPVKDDICSLSTGGAQDLYDKTMKEYRENASVLKS